MKTLNFMQNDKKFLEFLQERRKNYGELSIHPLLEEMINRYRIDLVDSFFLDGYLENNPTEMLNEEFLVLFDKATYLNEKSAMLQYLFKNNYNKEKLRKIIEKELLSDLSDYSDNDIECYNYDLNEILRQLKRTSK